MDITEGSIWYWNKDVTQSIKITYRIPNRVHQEPKYEVYRKVTNKYYVVHGSFIKENFSLSRV